MTIQELAVRAEVTTRTIRYYVEQGVLPPPERGRPAEYTEEHVARLALIKRLKEQYLPLDEIRDTMQRLSLPEVEALVADYSPQEEQSRKLDSAADYIANVFSRGKAREQMKQQAAPAPPVDRSRSASVPAPGNAPMPGATVPLAGSMGEAQTPYAQPAPAHAPTTPAYAPAPASLPPQAPAIEAPAPVALPQQPPLSAAEATESPGPSLASRLWSSVVGRRSAAEGAATSKEEGAYIEAPTSWQRVQLGEGIELHYLASDDARFNKLVARLVEAARRILDEGPGNGE